MQISAVTQISSQKISSIRLEMELINLNNVPAHEAMPIQSAPRLPGSAPESHG